MGAISEKVKLLELSQERDNTDELAPQLNLLYFRHRRRRTLQFTAIDDGDLLPGPEDLQPQIDQSAIDFVDELQKRLPSSPRAATLCPGDSASSSKVDRIVSRPRAA